MPQSGPPEGDDRPSTPPRHRRLVSVSRIIHLSQRCHVTQADIILICPRREHAYYVDYRNVRPSYVNAIWDVIDWGKVEERLVAAK